MMLVSANPYENEIVRRWWAIVPGSVLPLSSGGSVRVVFPGYPGGSMGPDVHDAVLYLSSSPCSVVDGELQSDLLEKRVGDVEFHIRASDWEVHQHHTDPCYNGVVLHVVLVCDRIGPTMRQDGQGIPVCSLQDLPLAVWQVPCQVSLADEHVWPCHRVRQRLTGEEYEKLLMQAGVLRFEQKAHVFVEQLHSVASIDEYGLYDTCLIPALAEGLGYGRDRAFFRAAGLQLLGKAQSMPEPLGRALEPSPLDVSRLHVLSRLVTQWGTPGIWMTLSELLLPGQQVSENVLIDVLQSLRDVFCMLGLSLARANILICNVVLPFAAAIALLEHDTLLYERAQAIYMQHPGLSSNRITRRMSTQLCLSKEPRGACQQQGLHYIYQQTCREKLCEVCLIGRREVGL
jgi:hypothetical protein